ncbi:hypothetical protein E2C01_063745 [Portunus trituberculatus]|uniref:Uncharacterized protein n=1 Tax=Portunus trituberculatus TaxID=210409 RepID=A0A5B7HBB1_PORTR|nr:hypothetical protein [Portunus trituberculatus]
MRWITLTSHQPQHNPGHLSPRSLPDHHHHHHHHHHRHRLMTRCNRHGIALFCPSPLSLHWRVTARHARHALPPPLLSVCPAVHQQVIKKEIKTGGLLGGVISPKQNKRKSEAGGARGGGTEREQGAEGRQCRSRVRAGNPGRRRGPVRGLGRCSLVGRAVSAERNIINWRGGAQQRCRVKH